MIDDGWPLLTTLHHPITVDRQLALGHADEPLAALHHRAGGSASCACRSGWPGALPAVVTVSESSRPDIAAQMGVAPERMTVVPVGVDHTVFRPRRRRDAGAGPASW